MDFPPALRAEVFLSQQFRSTMGAWLGQHISTMQTEPAAGDFLPAAGTNGFRRQYPGSAVQAELGVRRQLSAALWTPYAHSRLLLSLVSFYLVRPPLLRISTMDDDEF